MNYPSIVECFVCRRKSYIFCCQSERSVIETICELCLLDYQPTEQKKCNKCDRPFSNFILEFKYSLNREKNHLSAPNFSSHFGQQNQNFNKKPI